MDNPSDAVKSYQYYYAVAKCIMPNYPASDVASGKIGDSRVFKVGHLIDRGDGEQECNTIMPAAIKFWGYASLGDALKDWGYSQPTTTNTFWSNSSPASGTLSAIRKKIYNNSNPSLNDAQLYELYYNSFMSGCKATGGISYDSADAGVRTAAESGSGKYAITTIVTGSPPAQQKMIYTVDDPGAAISLVEDGAAISSSRECRTLANFITEKAPAYMTWAIANEGLYAGSSTATGVGGSEAASGEKGKSTCNVDGIGWTVCPVMNFLGGLMDKMVAYLGDTFLKTNSDLVKADDSNGTYVAWKIFRNYANIAFIIAFLFVIYSQITGAGASNYGLKRMLPRLIVSAILVNMSFIICQLAVDISNALGFGVTGLFQGVISEVGKSSNLAGTDSGSAWADAIGGANGVLLAGVGVALALALGILIPALVAVLLVVVILLARQAIIVLLIVAAPLAFVAYLLPNTEDWFKKWYKMFFNLLMVFPIIAGVFGASKLAAMIINTIGVTQDDGSLKLMALGITVIPFFVVPGLLKGAMAATGALGAKLQGYGDRATGNMGSKAKDNYKNSDFAKHRAQQAAIKKAQIKGGKYKGWSPVGRGRSLINRGINMVPGKYGSQRIARATSVDDKQHAENVEEASSMLATMTDKQIMAQAIDEKSSEAQREAAAMHIMTKGSHSDKKTLLESVNKNTFKRDSTRAAIADTYAKSEMASVYGKSIASDIRSGKAVDMQKKLLENSGDISATAVAGNANYARDVAAAHSEAKKPEASLDDQIAAGKIEALVANIDSDTSITPTVDANAALNGIRRPPSP